jgi:hypothetical protein
MKLQIIRIVINRVSPSHAHFPFLRIRHSPEQFVITYHPSSYRRFGGTCCLRIHDFTLKMEVVCSSDIFLLLITVSSHLTSRRPVDIYEPFEGTYCLHLQGVTV